MFSDEGYTFKLTPAFQRAITQADATTAAAEAALGGTASVTMARERERALDVVAAPAAASAWPLLIGPSGTRAAAGRTRKLI